MAEDANRFYIVEITEFDVGVNSIPSRIDIVAIAEPASSTGIQLSPPIKESGMIPMI